MPKIHPQPPDPDDDPYLWLEEREGKKALAWARAHSRSTEAFLGGPELVADTDALLAAFDASDSIPYIARRGRHVYNFWQDRKSRRGLWRRTTLTEYRKAGPAWETLIDLDRLARREREDWVWKGAIALPGDWSRALVMLSRGGADAHVLREFDLTTRRFVRNGFSLAEAKGTVAWIDRDTILVARSLGSAHDTLSGYPRSIRRWRRGTPFSAAEEVFSCARTDNSCYPEVNHTAEPPRITYVRWRDFFSEERNVVLADGSICTLDLPPDAQATLVVGDWMLVHLRSAWTPERRSFPAGALIAIRLTEFLAGKRRFVSVFRPGPRRILQGVTGAAEAVALTILDNVRSRIAIARPGPRGWTRHPVAGLPENATLGAECFDRDVGRGLRDDFLIHSSSPIEPPTTWLLTNGTRLSRLKRQPHRFSARGLAVSRHEARSSDGTKVPYFQVGPAAAPRDGTARVLMEGYGGFGLAMLPAYRASAGLCWLTKGGTYVVSCLRGGDEFGPAWHKAGMRAGKSLSHDDFAAIAADLVKRGVTRPELLACVGGSNGGLLVANMLTRYPDRFGAIVCAIPLIDMRRYTRMPAGASWIAEYGDPDKPEDWAFIRHFSAYHNVSAAAHYPPILITTSTRDDRVHPGHARKFAAKLEDLGYRVLFHESEAGGHSGGADNRQRAEKLAMEFAFIRRMLESP